MTFSDEKKFNLDGPEFNLNISECLENKETEVLQNLIGSIRRKNYQVIERNQGENLKRLNLYAFCVIIYKCVYRNEMPIS